MGDLIRKQRLKKRLRQTQLAEICGVSQGTVSAWENNLYLPCAKHLIMLADVLTISSEELISAEKNASAAAMQKTSP